MNKPFQALMHEATQLTRAGRLNEATAVLQRALSAAPTTVVAADDFVDVVDVDVADVDVVNVDLLDVEAADLTMAPAAVVSRV